MKSTLKKILLVGNSPLPNENEQVRPAAGLRTYQFLRPLVGRFDLNLVTIAMPECYKSEIVEGWVDKNGEEVESTDKKKFRFTIHKNNPGLKKILQEIHDEFQPEVIIGVNTYPSYVACSLQSHAPLWADLNGWIMAEAQAQAYKMDSNDYLGHYFEMERVVVARADKFSAVSRAESFALLGELASVGRLNKESFGYKFVEEIVNGIELFDGEEYGLNLAGSWKSGWQEESESLYKQQSVTGDAFVKDIPGNGSKTLNGLSKPEFGLKSLPGQTFPDEHACKKNSVPKDAFVLLWIGGYNTWVDEFTLFKAVNEAMQKCPNLYFVSTGGEIAGLDNFTFAKFKKMIDGSECKERFVFLGWVETAEIPSLYKRAQAGLNVDRRCLETMTGARNRINEMMKFGLPVITTKGSEIACEVSRVGAGVAVKSGDHAALGKAIEELYGEWRSGGGRETVKFKEYGKKGREYIEMHCNYEEALRPLLAWLENPRPAPDRGVRVGGFVRGIGGGALFGRRGGGGWRAGGSFLRRLRGLPGLRAMWRYLKQNGFKKSFRKFLQRMSG